jgi:SAM-dependent methyltransferase
MDIRELNRRRWDLAVEKGNRYTVPVGPEIVAAARQGQWSVVLTESKPVPRDWFPASLGGLDILCLASGGGQQGPIFAAAGATVTVLDLSPKQLAQDHAVAEKEGLELGTVEGDMRDLSMFAKFSFDLVFHPVSNLFVPEVDPVWQECARVLRPGGTLLAGFMNPDVYIFDYEKADRAEFEVRHKLPFDSTELDEEDRNRYFGETLPLEFSHTLVELIGGQIAAGFAITGFYDDFTDYPIGEYLPTYFATRAVKAKGLHYPEFPATDE